MEQYGNERKRDKAKEVHEELLVMHQGITARIGGYFKR
jgi:hypothetical protein